MHSTNSTEKMFKRNDRNVMVNFKPDEYMRKMIFQSVTRGVQSSLLWFSGRASRVATRARFLKGLLALIQDHPNPAVRRGGGRGGLRPLPWIRHCLHIFFRVACVNDLEIISLKMFEIITQSALRKKY